MSIFWDTLPGPRDFRRNLHESLLRGTDVFLLVPESGTESIPESIWCGLGEINDLSVERIEPDRSCSGDVVEEMWRCLGLEGTSPPVNERQLALEDCFKYRLLILEFGTGSGPAPWLEMVSAYSSSCHHLNEEIRSQTRFLCVLNGFSEADLPKPDTRLAIHSLQGHVTESDLGIHAMRQLAGPHTLEQKLKIEIATALSIWDIDLCNELLRLELPQLLHPNAFLEEYAQIRSWSDVEPDSSNLFGKGIACFLRGRKHVHSAWAALHADHKLINSRLWKAQVRSIFPSLDDFRRRLIDKYRDRWAVPYKTEDDREIKEKDDLELGHLCFISELS